MSPDVSNRDSVANELPGWAQAVVGCAVLFAFCAIGYQIYTAGIVDGLMNTWEWCLRHPILAIFFFCMILLCGKPDTASVPPNKDRYQELLRLNSTGTLTMHDDIDPSAEDRVRKAVGWFATEWERRSDATCPECDVSGYVVAKVPGLLQSDRWMCCNCESEGSGTIDDVDGRASTRLQQAKRNAWEHKARVVCSHCQIRGYVVFKKTLFGGRKLRMCCNCDVKEEFVK